MFDKPAHITSPFWYCRECRIVLNGPHQEAAKHFDEPDCWGHWLWEFRFEADRLFPYRPTGVELHTSDVGGYYRSDPPIHSPAEVYERVARKTINEALHATIPSRCTCSQDPEAWKRCPIRAHDHTLWTKHGWNCPVSCTHPDALAAQHRSS